MSSRYRRSCTLEHYWSSSSLLISYSVSGHETTTNTLGYTIWELARQPDIQQRLRQEVEAFPGEPDYDDFQTKLPYLDAVLRET